MLKWPIGINPEMDKHAIKFGYPNWSCISPHSNELWLRRDGVTYVFLDPKITYMKALKNIDCTEPIGSDFTTFDEGEQS